MTLRSTSLLCSLISLAVSLAACSSSDDGGGGSAGTAAGGTAGSAAGGGGTGGSSGGSGGSTGGTGGTAPANCTDLAPTGSEKLIISQVVPGMGIEVFNPGTTAVSLASVWFCSQYIYAQGPSASGKTEVPPGGYVMLGWPDGYELTTAADGELLLYVDPTAGAFPTDQNIVDYVCWGPFTGGRKDDPVGGGTLFPGACAAAPAAGAITRLPNTSGTDAASYDVTSAASLADCP